MTRTELGGSQAVLADRCQGKRLNSPNDIVVRSDDTIRFTGPDCGILSDFTGDKAPSEIGVRNVFRLDPRTGSLRGVCRDMPKPARGPRERGAGRQVRRAPRLGGPQWTH